MHLPVLKFFLWQGLILLLLQCYSYYSCTCLLQVILEEEVVEEVTMEEEVMMGEEVREVVGVAQETSAAEVAAAEGVQENGNFRKDKEQYIMELIKVLT